MSQLILGFESKKLFGVHDLRYHLLRVGVAELSNTFWQVNSIWEGYNSEGYPKEPHENRWSVYHKAESTKDIKSIIKNAASDNRKHYIMAAFDYGLIKSMKQYRD